MEHDQSSNEENTNNNPQKLFLKYLIESIQKQQQQPQDGPIDFSINTIKKEAIESNNLLNSNENIFQQFLQSPQQNGMPLKKRYRSNTPPDINQDDNYWERRRKNNEAAKRSRDVRRVKEDELALRAAWLEQANVKLQLENAHLKQENVQLRYQIYSSTES